MKTGFVLLIALTLSITLSAQTDLPAALGKGDVDAISAGMGEKVEMTIGNKEEILSKSQAVVRLREFYATHAPKGFRLMHSGNSKGNDTNYQIGELTTDKGVYRVYLYFTQEGGQRRIAEMRFEQ